MYQNADVHTVAVHGGTRKDDTFGAINEPIYMTSNYRIPTDGTPGKTKQREPSMQQRCEVFLSEN